MRSKSRNVSLPNNKRRIKAVVAYDGTAYCGFQRQKNDPTIQEALERALSCVCNERVVVSGSGRTDSGVHALGHVIHFDTHSHIPTHNILKGANASLPRDIALVRARDVDATFHARYSATGKIYRYVIWNSPVRFPLEERFCYHCVEPLDVVAMRRATRVFVGRHDFRAFCTEAATKENTMRTIRNLSVVKKGRRITFTFEGDGFLYNMVRAIVGTLVMVGRGKWTTKEVGAILASRKRALAGPTAPPQGLTLVNVLYAPRSSRKKAQYD